MCRGPGSHRARILCWSNQAAEAAWLELRKVAGFSCVDPVPVTSSSHWTPCTVCQMGDSNMYGNSSSLGRKTESREEFKDELFPGNFYPLPSKTPAFVPKEGGQRGQQVVCESSPHITSPTPQIKLSSLSSPILETFLRRDPHRATRNGSAVGYFGPNVL